jgi:hypothetical protein
MVPPLSQSCTAQYASLAFPPVKLRHCITPSGCSLVDLLIQDGLFAAMFDAFRISAAQIALGSVFGSSVQSDHPVGTAHHAVTAQFAVLHIDLHRTGLLVSFDEVMRAGIQANAALKAYQRRINGRFTAQNVDHRAIYVDHSFPLE